MEKTTLQKNETLMCSDCGKTLLPIEKSWSWGKCRLCGKPVCFGCSHYQGTNRKGLFMDEYGYVEVLRLCGKCYGEKRPKHS